MTKNKFPLLPDGEAMLGEMPHMNLYDEFDFISNIKGDYQDKNYLEWEPIAHNPLHEEQHKKEVNRRRQQSALVQNQSGLAPASKTYSELAREEARADLKKKRSASYLTSQGAVKSHGHKLTLPTKAKVANKTAAPTAFFQKEQAGEFAKFSKNLQQDDYILADIKPDYRPKEQQAAPKEKKKNNYDFLRTSQIYNNKEIRSQRERTIAQELNLTQIDDKN